MKKLILILFCLVVINIYPMNMVKWVYRSYFMPDIDNLIEQDLEITKQLNKNLNEYKQVAIRQSIINRYKNLFLKIIRPGIP